MSQQSKVPKAKGSCSHCLTSRQLHQKDGSVHLHGPRNNPCPGSKRPPLEAGGTPLGVSGVGADLGVDGARLGSHTGASPVPRQTVADVGPDGGASHPVNHGPLLKHICKGARQACSQALTSTLQEICKTPDSLPAWRKLFNFAPVILAQPNRAG
jgi:hypothetical protein